MIITMRSELKETYKWYEEGNGEFFIREHTNVSDYVRKHLKGNGTKEVSGVYMISYEIIASGARIPVAIGESRQMGVRFIQHMKKLNEEGELLWGISPSVMKEKGIKISIEIIEDNILNETDRKKKEAELITTRNPILQAKYDKHYPRDKAEKRGTIWVKRDDIRPDQYIKKPLRKERVNDELSMLVR